MPFTPFYRSGLFIVPFLGLTLTSAIGTGDILIRFPAATSGDHVTAVAAQIERQIGIPTRGITGVETPAAQEVSLPLEVEQALTQATAAYKQLDLPRAQILLDQVETRCLDRTSLEICRPVLFDAYLLRGVVESALNNSERSAQYFRSAHHIDPTQVVDPRLYPPRTIRAFNRAAKYGERIAPWTVRLQSEPHGATFTVDTAELLPLSPGEMGPGRHVVEAVLPGYHSARRVVEIDVRGTGPTGIVITLTALDDTAAWEQLRREISSPRPEITRPGLSHLFHRFAIEHVITVAPPVAGASGYGATLATVGRPEQLSLPPIGMAGEPVSPAFVDALRSGLGLPSPDVAPPSPARVTVTPPDPDTLEEDDEDEEDAAQKLHLATDDITTREDWAELTRSPWFWVSISVVVAAIATGVVIGVQ